VLPPGIVQATHEHVVELAETMGEADRAEVWAGAKQTPQEALQRCMKHSLEAHSWLVDGRVICMWGVGQYTPLSLVGVPWMLGSYELPKHARTFARGSRAIAAEWQKRYPVLRNFVDARHTLAVRWVQWIGFTLLPAIPYGPDGLPFYPFESERA